MVFIVFLMGKKKSLKEKEVYVYNDTKRDNRPEFHARRCFYSHHRVGKKNKKRVCPLSHIHIVVEFRLLAAGRTCLCSLCMAQTGASQPRPDSQGVKGDVRGGGGGSGGGGGGGGGSGLAL